MRRFRSVLGRRTANQRGAALLEVLVAALLLSLAVIPLFMALTTVLTTMQKSVVSTIATNLLQDRAEKLKAYGYTYVGPGTLAVGLSPSDDYYGTAYVIFQEVVNVQGMTTGTEANSTSIVRKVTLTAYRRPFSLDPTITDRQVPAPGQVPVAKWEFLLYADGI